jgi:hypothetical protein
MGEWWIIDGTEQNTDKETVDEPDFDPHVIARLEHTIRETDLKWQAYFQNNAIIPLILSYEDLASDYSANIVRILKWLGVPNADAVAIRPSRLKRQSNALNEDWLSRYEAFKSDTNHPAQILIPIKRISPLAKRSQLPLDVIPGSGSGRLLARNALKLWTRRSSRY